MRHFKWVSFGPNMVIRSTPLSQGAMIGGWPSHALEIMPGLEAVDESHLSEDDVWKRMQQSSYTPILLVTRSNVTVLEHDHVYSVMLVNDDDRVTK